MRHISDGIYTDVVVSDRWILGAYYSVRPGTSWTARSVPREPNGTYTVFNITRTVDWSIPCVIHFTTSSTCSCTRRLLQSRSPAASVPSACRTSGRLLESAAYWSAEDLRCTSEHKVINVTAVSWADCRSGFGWLRQEHTDQGVFCARSSARGPDGRCRVAGNWPPVMAELTRGGVRRWFLVGMMVYRRVDCDGDIETYAIAGLINLQSGSTQSSPTTSPPTEGMCTVQLHYVPLFYILPTYNNKVCGAFTLTTQNMRC